MTVATVDFEARVAQIVDSIDLEDTTAVTAFGRRAEAGGALHAVTDLISASPVAALAETLRQIVECLAKANPSTMAKRVTLLQRFTGSWIERRLNYDAARSAAETLLATAEAQAEVASNVLARVDQERLDLQGSVAELNAHIEAAKRYLGANAATPTPASPITLPTRDRLARRAQSLATLAASTELAIQQLTLASVQCADLLERYADIREVLLPVWRQQALAVANQSNLDSKTLAAAHKAHAALTDGLAKCLAPTQH